MMGTGFLAMALLFLPLAGTTDEGKLVMRILPPPGGIVLGQPFRIIVEEKGGGSEPLLFNEPADFGPLVKVLDYQREKVEGSGFDQRCYRVMALRSGRLAIPPIPAEAESGKVFLSNGAEVDVRSPIPKEDQELRVPDLLQPLPDEKIRLFLPCFLAGALVLLCIVGWMRFRRGTVPSDLPRLDPFAEAREALRRLGASPRETPEDLDAFYVNLSRILRRLLSVRFQVKALGMTSDEISMALQQGKTLEPAKASELALLFEGWDKAKFAGRKVDAEKTLQELAEAEHLVETLERRSKGDEESFAAESRGGRG